MELQQGILLAKERRGCQLSFLPWVCRTRWLGTSVAQHSQGYMGGHQGEATQEAEDRECESRQGKGPSGEALQGSWPCSQRLWLCCQGHPGW